MKKYLFLIAIIPFMLLSCGKSEKDDPEIKAKALLEAKYPTPNYKLDYTGNDYVGVQAIIDSQQNAVTGYYMNYRLILNGGKDTIDHVAKFDKEVEHITYDDLNMDKIQEQAAKSVLEGDTTSE
jgi:hypothetical protein